MFPQNYVSISAFPLVKSILIVTYKSFERKMATRHKYSLHKYNIIYYAEAGYNETSWRVPWRPMVSVMYTPTKHI